MEYERVLFWKTLVLIWICVEHCWGTYPIVRRTFIPLKSVSQISRFYREKNIWLYLGLITLIWAYLPLIALILPHVPIVPYSPLYAFLYWDCTSVQNFRAIGPLFMEILHFRDLEDTRLSVISECSLGVNLVIDNFLYVVSDTAPLHTIWKQSDHYLWRYCILKIWGIQVSFGCERSCSSPRRVSIAIYLRGVSTPI